MTTEKIRVHIHVDNYANAHSIQEQIGKSGKTSK